ncbi:hypothetical protein MAPG_07329 [Magnaporthiopsis poae ATCC 64411]|uniref:Uncharacterized protein n=1 Tax=Magnaporthiopsis poae (strain ATCC 64411 / 73-15) TaxID=644358 RepID=A0A0C4E4D6_MAGP6|nr:hypothetical protein MAPG_07329 [Magnaporthiopsis poae ATCC 64411]
MGQAQLRRIPLAIEAQIWSNEAITVGVARIWSCILTGVALGSGRTSEAETRRLFSNGRPTIAFCRAWLRRPDPVFRQRYCRKDERDVARVEPAQQLVGASGIGVWPALMNHIVFSIDSKYSIYLPPTPHLPVSTLADSDRPIGGPGSSQEGRSPPQEAYRLPYPVPACEQEGAPVAGAAYILQPILGHQPVPAEQAPWRVRADLGEVMSSKCGH